VRNSSTNGWSRRCRRPPLHSGLLLLVPVVVVVTEAAIVAIINGVSAIIKMVVVEAQIASMISTDVVIVVSAIKIVTEAAMTATMIVMTMIALQSVAMTAVIMMTVALIVTALQTTATMTVMVIVAGGMTVTFDMIVNVTAYPDLLRIVEDVMTTTTFTTITIRMTVIDGTESLIDEVHLTLTNMLMMITISLRNVVMMTIGVVLVHRLEKMKADTVQ
jgi:hypothetical protein